MNAAFQIQGGQLYERALQFDCPCCHRPLWISKGPAPVTVFCANEVCESRITNKGVKDSSLDGALAMLALMVEEEQVREYWQATMIIESHDCIA